MIYSNFIKKTSKYLKSVRILSNYISFDMVFPDSWVMLKKAPQGLEIILTDSNEGGIHSFVCENEEKFLNLTEQTIDILIKTNIEREEKERLFRSKVSELKNIFEKEKLENLKGLKFDMEELTKFIVENEKGIESEVSKRVETTE